MEIYTVQEAEEYKARLESMQEFERLYPPDRLVKL